MFETIVGIATILGTIIVILTYLHHKKSKSINKEPEHLTEEKAEKGIPGNNHTNTIVKEDDREQKNISHGLIDSPLKIWESIKKAKDLPPYQREEMAKNYIGLKVRWEGMLSSLIPERGKDEMFISLRDENWDRNFICFRVRASVYPELKVMHENTPIEIEGNILHVRFDYIELENAKLFY